MGGERGISGGFSHPSALIYYALARREAALLILGGSQTRPYKRHVAHSRGSLAARRVSHRPAPINDTLDIVGGGPGGGATC